MAPSPAEHAPDGRAVQQAGQPAVYAWQLRRRFNICRREAWRWELSYWPDTTADRPPNTTPSTTPFPSRAVLPLAAPSLLLKQFTQHCHSDLLPSSSLPASSQSAATVIIM